MLLKIANTLPQGELQDWLVKAKVAPYFMVLIVNIETQAFDRLSMELTVSSDVHQAGTGDDCYWINHGFCDCLAGQAFLPDDSMILFSRIDLPVGFSRGNRASVWVHAAGPVPAHRCLTIDQPEDLTL